MRCCRELAIIVLIAGSARSEPKLRADAQLHFDRAMAAYNAKDYDLALAELRTAYAIDPRPDLVYAQAQAQRMAGKCTDAIATYRRYLALHPPQEEAAKAERHIARCGDSLPSPAPQAATPLPAGPPPPPRESPAWYRDRLGIAIATGGIIAAGIGAGFLVAASSSVAAANNAPDYATFLEDADRAQSRNLIGSITVAAGTTLLGLGVVRLVF